MEIGRPRPVTLVTLLAAAVALVVALVVAPPALGDPRDDKQRVDAEVAMASAGLETATDRAQAAARLFAEANAALPGAELRVGEARGRVAAARVLADEAGQSAAAAQAALDAANATLATADQGVDDAQDRLGQFVASAYKGSGFLTLNVVFEARTPAELASRLGYLERVVDNQRSALDSLLTARLDAKLASNASLVARRGGAEAALAAQRALGAARDRQLAAEQAVAAVAALTEQRRSALVVAAQTREESLARYEQVKAESARIEAELRAWEAKQKQEQPGPAPGPVLRPGARLLMPVQGWKSSDFGMRYDPFYDVWQLHAGVDVAADGGQPIYAAADGLVISAGWNGGYGNYTCVYHGAQPSGGLATCYAHQSQILVDEGQRVRRGEVIGRVGTTGASTGNHLHFEVRIGGEPVEPLNWLPGCLC